jgi:hypothetical protein
MVKNLHSRINKLEMEKNNLIQWRNLKSQPLFRYQKRRVRTRDSEFVVAAPDHSPECSLVVDDGAEGLVSAEEHNLAEF